MQGGPPPQGPPAGPPPGSQWGPPPGQPARSGGSFDPKSVNQLDWGILAAGVLAFIFSLFDYYTYSVSAGPYSASVSFSAWHGFFGWFAFLCALVGSVVVAMEIFAPHTKLPFPNRLIGLAAYALATLCVILALFIFPGSDYSGAGIDEGHGFGYWASLVVIVAGLVLSFMRFQQTGGQLPIGGGSGGGLNKGSRPGSPSGPPPGYGPPPGSNPPPGSAPPPPPSH
jgi:hypothetical protein